METLLLHVIQPQISTNPLQLRATSFTQIKVLDYVLTSTYCVMVGKQALSLRLKEHYSEGLMFLPVVSAVVFLD